MTDFLYLDIETIPTTDEEHIASIAASITPPKSMSKPETIAAWEQDTKPGLVAEAVAKTSFNGAFGRVCCIGWAWNDGAVQSIYDGGTLATGGEIGMLGAAFRRINDGAPPHAVPTIVGHFVAGFDIRFLWQRAIVLGVAMPHWLPRDPKPWSRGVFDTMNAWCGAKDSISLDNLCKAIGVAGKDGIDGSMVAGMWQRCQFNEVAEYCRADVERVRNVHRKMQVAYGEAA